MEPTKNHSWVVVALGHDVNAFVGEPYPDDDGEVGLMFCALANATRATQIRQTMDRTWQAKLWNDEEDLGFYCLYEEG